MPTGEPKIRSLTVSSVAAGGTGTMNLSGFEHGIKARLYAVLVSSTVPFKADICVANAHDGCVTKAMGVSQLGSWWWVAPGSDFLISSDPLDDSRYFGAHVTNLDPTLAADFYATFYWYEGG